jgi:hypothetical protein
MFTKTIQRSCVVAQFALLLALGAAAGCSSGNGSPGTTGGTPAATGGAGPNTGGATGAGGAGGVSSTSANTGGAATSSSARRKDWRHGRQQRHRWRGHRRSKDRRYGGSSSHWGRGHRRRDRWHSGKRRRKWSRRSTLIGGPGPASQLIAQSGTDWGKLVIDTEIAGKTSLGSTYPEGLILHGMSKAYKRLKDPNLSHVPDDIGGQAGALPTGPASTTSCTWRRCVTPMKSRKPPATRRLRMRLEGSSIPTPPTEGAFWHANNGTRDHQLWGDGVFMSLSFLTRYATVFNDPTVYPIAVTNLSRHGDTPEESATNLFWHAYDESGVATWAKTNEQDQRNKLGPSHGMVLTGKRDDPGNAACRPIQVELR